MGVMIVEVAGRTFRYYDDGLVLTRIGDTVEVVGKLDESALSLYRVDTDEERIRSEQVLVGRIRAMALKYLEEKDPDPT